VLQDLVLSMLGSVKSEGKAVFRSFVGGFVFATRGVDPKNFVLVESSLKNRQPGLTSTSASGLPYVFLLQILDG
jgi:hypothetical protein